MNNSYKIIDGEFKRLYDLAWYFAKYVVPDEKCPIEIRSNVPIEEMRDVNYKCLQILVAVAFEKGWLYIQNNPLASHTQIQCAAIDYVSPNHYTDIDKIKFFQHCYRCGAYCKKENPNVILV